MKNMRMKCISKKKYDDEDIKTSHEKILPVLKELYQLSCRAVVETSPPMGGAKCKVT